MKYRAIAGLIGASMIMATLVGCEATQKNKETELQTVELLEMEILDETEPESEFQSGTEDELGTTIHAEEDTEAETVEVDLGLADETAIGKAAEDTSMIVETELSTEKERTYHVGMTPVEKPGEAKRETERQTQRETKGQSETARETERQTHRETKGQSETARQTERQTQRETKGQSETVRQTERQTQSETKGQSETVRQTERQTQSETKGQSETVRETESETVRQTEEITETETERQTEEITETETERQTESETETEAAVQLSVMIINDRVNVRTEPSTDAEIKALLVCGMPVIKVESDGEWTKVRYESQNGLTDGYVKTEFLNSANTLYTANKKVNVRAEASEEADKLGALSGRQKVLVEESMSNGWSKIRFMNEGVVTEGYVKSEFLSKVETGNLSSTLVSELERLAEELGAEVVEEPHSETRLPVEAETEEGTELSTEAETEEGTELLAETETEEETELPAETETEEETELPAETETEEETELPAETETEEGTELPAETETEEETELPTETETEEETELPVETETEEETELPTETETASEVQTESETEKIVLTEGIAGQFTLAKMLFPEIKSVGIIYASGNANAARQLDTYERQAAKFNISMISSEIAEEIDIDLAASELVGSVDCIFCMEDETVSPLIQTIRAYADEVGIPVIGLDESHVNQGCVAAYKDGSILLNTEEADKLDLDVSSIQFDEIIQY